MAYPHLFGVGRSYKFSSPDLVCEGSPCGVKDYANAVRAIGLTTPKISQIYDSVSAPIDGGDTGSTEPTPTTDKVFAVEGPVALPDKQTLTLPIKVSAQQATSAEVDIDITHQFRGDISIMLYAPDNGYWMLKKANNYDRRQTYQVKFTLNDVDPAATEGEWRLVIQDHKTGKVGTLNSFRLSFP